MAILMNLAHSHFFTQHRVNFIAGQSTNTGHSGIRTYLYKLGLHFISLPHTLAYSPDRNPLSERTGNRYAFLLYAIVPS